MKSLLYLEHRGIDHITCPVLSLSVRQEGVSPHTRLGKMHRVFVLYSKQALLKTSIGGIRMTSEEYWEEFDKSMEGEKNDPPPECGSFFSYVDPETGRLKSGVYRCGKWRVCEACMDNKVQGEFERLLSLENEGHTLYYTVTDKDHWKAKAKRLRRRGIAYKRYPGASVYVVVATEELSVLLGSRELELPSGKIESGELGFSYEFCDGVLRDVLKDAPDNERVSGHLKSQHWAKVEEEEREDRKSKVAITVEAVGTDAGREVRRRAWIKATEQTRAPVQKVWMSDAMFAMEVKNAVAERTRVYKEELEKEGVTITFTQRWRVGVHISQVEWEEHVEYSDARDVSESQPEYMSVEFWAGLAAGAVPQISFA